MVIINTTELVKRRVEPILTFSEYGGYDMNGQAYNVKKENERHDENTDFGKVFHEALDKLH